MESKLIIDLDELQEAICAASMVCVSVHDSSGLLVTCVEISKEHALERAVENNYFDGCASKLIQSRGLVLILNHTPDPNVRARRQAYRNVRRHEIACAMEYACKYNGRPVPQDVLDDLAATAPGG